ncbi:uncharacterized protein GGS22DRAFT_161431 [Annulohypoxylon maeteangense]|uniref:uncharacterized protein n=1 Tax=Annulohypoxylon maeteangense TaxID=1927788 RepID=UPI0020085994|nr:uncharacterized protein GGS22DRAFT_161431 [Annulohypoxylon maeteangense]KAI0885626.1 hypothetical protein GGS22DRAFT_161431 [Annulohypoxylon maeteangense]
MLSTYLQNESRRWAAQHHRQSYPASASPSQNESSNLSSYEDSDCDSVFSRTSSRSRRSSVSSIASEDEEAPVAFDQPRDLNGAPITMYASLDQAVAQSTQMLEAEGPRRLVTPGKLYENEEDDDEIIEDDMMMHKNSGNISTQHYSGGLTHTSSSSMAAAG